MTVMVWSVVDRQRSPTAMSGNDFKLLAIFYTDGEEYRGAMPLRKFDPVMKKYDISFTLQIAGNKGFRLSITEGCQEQPVRTSVRIGIRVQVDNLRRNVT
jgi:hypothetical protein